MSAMAGTGPLFFHLRGAVHTLSLGGHFRLYHGSILHTQGLPAPKMEPGLLHAVCLDSQNHQGEWPMGHETPLVPPKDADSESGREMWEWLCPALLCGAFAPSCRHRWQ